MGAPDGELLGTEVGAGETDGDKLGVAVGEAVGVAVGVAVGSGVGAVDGLAEGGEVGAVDGPAEGAELGAQIVPQNFSRMSDGTTSSLLDYTESAGRQRKGSGENMSW